MEAKNVLSDQVYEVLELHITAIKDNVNVTILNNLWSSSWKCRGASLIFQEE